MQRPHAIASSLNHGYRRHRIYILVSLHILTALLLTTGIPASDAQASQPEASEQQQAPNMNSGIIYSGNNAYSLTAPEGWVLDNTSGAGMGLNAVFYPKGSNWLESKAVCYASVFPKPTPETTVEDVVSATVESFKSFASKIDNEHQGRIKAESGAVCELYYYHYMKGERENYDAVCYFTEKNAVNAVVMNAASKELFDKTLPKLKALAETYAYLGEDIEVRTPQE